MNVVDAARLDRLRQRWRSSKRISSADVDWLLERSDRLETMIAARNLASATGSTAAEERFAEAFARAVKRQGR